MLAPLNRDAFNYGWILSHVTNRCSGFQWAAQIDLALGHPDGTVSCLLLPSIVADQRLSREIYTAIFATHTVLSNSVKLLSLQLRVFKCWRYQQKEFSLCCSHIFSQSCPDATALHKRMHQVKGCLQENMLVMPLFPFWHCHPPGYSINSVRHWNWEFVKSHLSWIKNSIVGRQSSYSKHFSETGTAELPNTTSVSINVARRGRSVRLAFLSFVTFWLTLRAFHLIELRVKFKL